MNDQEPKGNRCGCSWWLTKPCPAPNCTWNGKRPVDAGVAPAHAPADLLKLAKECGATIYTNRHLPGEPAVAFGNESWPRFCAALGVPVDAPILGYRVDASYFQKWGSIPKALRYKAIALVAASGGAVQAPDLAEHYRQAIAQVCEGWTLPEGARKILEAALWNQPAPGVQGRDGHARTGGVETSARELGNG